MTRYACTNYGCPTRESVTAPSPPICYTCARPMAAVWTVDDVECSFGGLKFRGFVGGSGPDDMTGIELLRRNDENSKAFAERVKRELELIPANRPTNSETKCPAEFSGSAHTYLPGAERCFCGAHSIPQEFDDDCESLGAVYVPGPPRAWSPLSPEAILADIEKLIAQ